MFLSDDFSVSEVLARTETGGFTLVEIEGELEDPQRLRKKDYILTAERSRLARTLVNGIALPRVSEVEQEGSEMAIETGIGVDIELDESSDSYLYGPFSSITDPAGFHDLSIDGASVRLNYLLADSGAILGERSSGFRIEEGDDVARLGGFDVDEIAVDYSTAHPGIPNRFPNDTYFFFKYNTIRSQFWDPERHPDPHRELLNSDEIEKDDYDEVYDPLLSESENPENELRNSFIGDKLYFPIESQAYMPAGEFSSMDQLDGLNLQDVVTQRDIDLEKPQDTVLARSEEAITYDGFYTVLLKNQAAGLHLHSVVGDPHFQDPMILEYQRVIHTPANGRAFLVEAED